MVWLIGSETLLGSEIARRLDEKKISWVSGSEINVFNVNELNTFADSLDASARQTGASVKNGKIPSKVEYVINCLTCLDVNLSISAEQLEKLNADASLNIARTTRRMAAKLIQFSSDAVFSGTKESYTEISLRDSITPLGKSLIKGEDYIEKEITQYYILRLGSVYGKAKSNFIYPLMESASSMQKLRSSDEIVMNPLCVQDAVQIVMKIIDSSKKPLFGKKSVIPYGVYNVGSSNSATLFDFENAFLQIEKKLLLKESLPEIENVPKNELAPAAGLLLSVLDSGKIAEALKRKIPSWDESLEHFIKSTRLPKA